MIRQREKVIEKTSIITQTFISLVCFYTAIKITHHFITPLNEGSDEYKVMFFIIVPIWYVLLNHFAMGRMLRIKMYSSILFEYFTIVGLGVALLFIFMGFMEFKQISRWVMMLFIAINFSMLFSYKILSYKLMKIVRSRGYNYRHIIIIADKDSYYFIDRVIETKDWGYQLFAIISDSKEIKEKYGNQFTIISEKECISKVIDNGIVDEVMFCKSNFNQDILRKIINLCVEVGITFRMQSELFSIASARSHISYINQFPFLTFMNTPDNYLALKMKSVIDYVVSTLILLSISPVLLCIALAIKMDDGGPVFFKQVRVGQNGRLFHCLKFRTMITNAEDLKNTLMDKNEQDGPVFKIKNDPRVTKVGRFLRKSSLDELPQFMNVLKGEMSIVGPRPPVPSEVRTYERWQRRRLSMKPGITCIWQVSGRNDIPFDQWMKMDMQYIDSWSLKLDLLLFIRTFKVLLVRTGQ